MPPLSKKKKFVFLQAMEEGSQKDIINDAFVVALICTYQIYMLYSYFCILVSVDVSN